MAKFQPWLKMWVEWLDDPKMLGLSLAEQGAWWRLCSLAKKCAADGFLVKGNGAPLSLAQIADALRIKGNDRRVFDSMVKKMTDQGSVHWDHNVLVVTHFTERQEKTSSETTEALRDRQQRRRMKMWEDYGMKDSAIPLETRLLVIERDKCLCQHCGKQGIRSTTDSSVVLDPEDGTPFELDHIIPRARGGSDDAENLLLSCRPCNRKRRVVSPPLTTPLIDKDKDIDTEAERHRDKTVTNSRQNSKIEPKLDPVAAKIYSLYEQTCGVLTSSLASKVNHFCDNYEGPVEWIGLAFAEAVKYKNRRWEYIEAILYSWQEKGGPHADRREPGGERGWPGADKPGPEKGDRFGGFTAIESGPDEPDDGDED